MNLTSAFKRTRRRYMTAGRQAVQGVRISGVRPCIYCSAVIMRMVIKVRIMTCGTVTAGGAEQWCQRRYRLQATIGCMTVCTGTAVLACTVVMDLTATDKRSGDSIRGCAAAHCIMTAVTCRINVRYRCTMVYCCRSIRMDCFPGVRRWVMTRRTRY